MFGTAIVKTVFIDTGKPAHYGLSEDTQAVFEAVAAGARSPMLIQDKTWQDMPVIEAALQDLLSRNFIVAASIDCGDTVYAVPERKPVARITAEARLALAPTG